MCDFTTLLGPTLKTKDGETSTSEALAGKAAVGLYFSAHWCPPCRGFTPELAKCYSEHYKDKGLEIVFVSSDRDEESFNSYHAEQPWLALPYAQRDIKAKLSKKFKVQGIPTLVILDGASGETITTDGREAVSEDPSGKDFPWRPPTFFDALGDEFLSGTDGETVTLDELKDKAKYIGLYFSAHWCPPCLGFTPSLVTSYKEHLKDKGLEIIFVSSDRDQSAFMEYYDTMPWLAIPQGDPRKSKLSKLFGVQGIPSLAIVDAKSGETITTEGRGAVGGDPEGKELPWFPKALHNLSAGEGINGINEEPSLCVLLDGCDAATTEAAKAVLEPIAEAAKAAKEEMHFFYAPSAEGPVEQVRKLTKLGEAPSAPQVVLLDIPDEGGYYTLDASEVTSEGITKLLTDYKAGRLERKQLE